ncbi:MAG: MBL fold metallo-hydrolase [Gammaproteobacteria bacterium]|nr:MBL fold metallo-hydrolase [Gammaproteobacteria bacterium]MDH5652723.1 MBL fold metallo-hydrolase [Gammaproteobacteria bacterium]
MNIQFFGAAGEVTGSCYLITVGKTRLLVDCGLFQGGRATEEKNLHGFPFDPAQINLVILTHAHIDHSGRLPLLVKAGFKGHIYCHNATRDLCEIMLKDSAFLMEKDAEIENRKRQRKRLLMIAPLYSINDARKTIKKIKGIRYHEIQQPHATIKFQLSDAGHILGSSILELWLQEENKSRKLVFSGDLGNYGKPILRDPETITAADWLFLESTYGNRLHRPLAETIAEIGQVIQQAHKEGGNILIPAFAVGRTQELLYFLTKHFHDWSIQDWNIFVDSPMAIDATAVYQKHASLYDQEATELLQNDNVEAIRPLLHFTKAPRQSSQINSIRSGAIIIAGSGMCTGGRIKHHLKHNLWRRECHIMIVGFQARGTLGRALVDGAKHVRLWGETIKVAAQVNTVGGLSAHADQHDLLRWLKGFDQRLRIVLVHGENEALEGLASAIEAGGEHLKPVIARYKEIMELD